MRAIQRKWNDLGFWEYSCGCYNYQDGWDYCSIHKERGGYVEVLKDYNWSEATIKDGEKTDEYTK